MDLLCIRNHFSKQIQDSSSDGSGIVIPSSKADSNHARLQSAAFFNASSGVSAQVIHPGGQEILQYIRLHEYQAQLPCDT